MIYKIKKAIFPSGFDPININEWEEIKKLEKEYDILYLYIFNEVKEKYLFSLEKRKSMLKKLTEELDSKKIKIISQKELTNLSNFIKEHKIDYFICLLFDEFLTERESNFFEKFSEKNENLTFNFRVDKTKKWIYRKEIKNLIKKREDFIEFIPKKLTKEDLKYEK